MLGLEFWDLVMLLITWTCDFVALILKQLWETYIVKVTSAKTGIVQRLNRYGWAS